jgi:ATPase subunit of ABC transporter with duplicated ATPase domains
VTKSYDTSRLHLQTKRPSSSLHPFAALNRGEKVGLVGPNGAGKTTLFRMIAGEDAPDEGQVSVDRGVTIGYCSQESAKWRGAARSRK